MDYELQRATRLCAATGRELAEGEVFYSVLVSHDRDVVRHDYAADAWQGPPGEALAWWKSQVPSRAARKAKMAPNEVLLEYFLELQSRPEQQDTLYVLALLLIRRRVLQLESRETSPGGMTWMVLFAARDEQQHRVLDQAPSEDRIVQIEQELAQLLYATAQ